MNKWTKFLISLLLFIPFFVKADMASPSNDPYEVEVIKESIPYYESARSGMIEKGTLSKGEKITIDYQMTRDGVNYGMAEIKNSLYYVKLSDVFARGEIKPEDANQIEALDEPESIVVTGEVSLRKGPSEAYEEITTIKDKELKYSYYTFDPEYFYVEYKGYKGWVEKNDNILAYKASYYVLDEVFNSDCGNYSFGEIIHNVWLSNKGELVIRNSKKDTCSMKYTDVYKSLFALYGNGVVVKTKEQLIILENPTNTNSVAITVPEGAEMYIYESTAHKFNNTYYYFVGYKDQKGWISFSGGMYDHVEFIKNEKINWDEKQESDEDEEDEEEEKETSTVLLICVIVGVAVALAALVIIILVNKKKKVKVAE